MSDSTDLPNHRRNKTVVSRSWWLFKTTSAQELESQKEELARTKDEAERRSQELEQQRKEADDLKSEIEELRQEKESVAEKLASLKEELEESGRAREDGDDRIDELEQQKLELLMRAESAEVRTRAERSSESKNLKD